MTTIEEEIEEFLEEMTECTNPNCNSQKFNVSFPRDATHIIIPERDNGIIKLRAKLLNCNPAMYIQIKCLKCNTIVIEDIFSQSDI